MVHKASVCDVKLAQQRIAMHSTTLQMPCAPNWSAMSDTADATNQSAMFAIANTTHQSAMFGMAYATNQSAVCGMAYATKEAAIFLAKLVPSPSQQC